MPVRLLVDAFNYRDWGAAAGRVESIPADAVAIGGQPFFRVRCTLESDRLRLRSGVEARLRRGLAVEARFVVTRRTLLQLLRDRAADWFDSAAPDHQPPRDLRVGDSPAAVAAER
jgi:HlyD family secretion protein